MKFLSVGPIKLDLDESEELLVKKAASGLGVSVSDIRGMEIIRKSVDARRHRPPHFVYLLKISISRDIKLSADLSKEIHIQEINDQPKLPLLFPVNLTESPVVVIGGGPAGLFAAYALAKRGITSVLLERGKSVQERIKDVDDFWNKGILNTQSNVFFGEGGAGTFSDGKLTSRTNHPYSLWVKRILVENGAPPEILYEAKPHIGTDKLRRVMVNLRKKLADMGCIIKFQSQATDFLISNGIISAVIINEKEEIKTHNVILAIGQSADDTYLKLHLRGVCMESKPFAIGLRVEHPQELINSIQYGKWSGHSQLPAAEYFIKAALPDLNRWVYTFCMCPGGSVIGCGCSAGLVITNGMSHHRRSGEYANSAIVVNVRAEDFSSGRHPLEGLGFRQIWERKAFLAGGSDYRAPAQNIVDFIEKRGNGSVSSTSFLPGINPAVLEEVLPQYVVESLRRGIREFDKKMPGFITEEAVLIGVETRTSSPVRISRGIDGQSLSVRGVYPCGEGAGYAGGIISSALDGIKAAQHLINNLDS